MINNPLVSICVPTFNGAKYILEALESAINQDYSNIEIIISDDNSKDDTVSICKIRLEKSNISYKILLHKPSGIGENWNHAIRQSRGKYIKLLFQDDLLSKSCISKMVLALENNESAGMVFCTRTIIFESSIKNGQWLSKFKELHKNWGFKLKENSLISGKYLLGSRRLLDQPLNKIGEPTTTLIRRTCFDKIGYFENDLVQALDLEYWYRIMAKYDLVFINEKLVSFRLHQEQQSSKNQKRKIKDFKRLPFIMFRRYFWDLDGKVKKRILKDIFSIIVHKIIKR